MRRGWREIVIELTPEQEPVWEQAITMFWRQTARAAEYYECPISPPVKGKASLPFDPDLILELIAQLKRLDNTDVRICNEISQKLAALYSREKMI